MVKAGPGRVIVMAHVPLANECGLDASRLKILRKEPGATRDRPLVVDNPVMMHVLAGQNRSSARGTERGGHECVGEVHALLRQPIEVRGLQPLRRLRMKPQKVMPMIIGENENDISCQWLVCTQ